MTTQAELDQFVKDQGFWSERNGDRTILNCGDPSAVPQDADPTSGEVCVLCIDQFGGLHFEWKQDGYDEHLAFEKIEDFAKFYGDFLSEGINDINYDNYNCVIL